MPAIVDCPSCNRKLRVPDELLGRNVKCPTCSTTFQASAAPAASAAPTSFTPAPPIAKPQAAPVPPTAKPQAADEEAAADAPPTAHKRCPYCGENVVADAERCQHCGEALEGEDRPWERHAGAVRRDSEPHRGGMILTFGIVSVCLGPIGMVPGCCYLNIIFSGPGLGLGIAAIVMGQRDLAKMAQGVMDPQGRGTTQAGWICGIVGTVLNALAMVAWVGLVIVIAITIASGP